MLFLQSSGLSAMGLPKAEGKLFAAKITVPAVPFATQAAQATGPVAAGNIGVK